MEVKEFKGKAIYNPSGKAGEYAKWACNFHVGCSHGCTYCYLKKGRGAAILGGCEPKLKACFKNELHAIEVFENELLSNLEGLRKHGLFLSFTTDPMLRETIYLTMMAVCKALQYDVPVKILTKNANFFEDSMFKTARFFDFTEETRSLVVFGFTLTGHDELEPGASTNAERIEAMRKLHDAGFKTFASIEPIIDFESSEMIIAKTKSFCDLYKIGLESGKSYNSKDIIKFMNAINIHLSFQFPIPKVYWKDSLLKQAKINRVDLPSNCVNKDYNIFNH